MDDMPRSPRERMLAEDEPTPLGEVADLAEARAAQAAAAREEAARMMAAETPPEVVLPPDETDTPEILTLSEIEGQLARIERAVAMREQVRPMDLNLELDDALQGIVTLLGMRFGGDVQMLVFQALRVYRDGKGYRG